MTSNMMMDMRMNMMDMRMNKVVSETHKLDIESFRRMALLAVLWDEYQDTAEEAREALRMGDKPKALALSILANKIRGEYEYADREQIRTELC